ncbi:unnamed protein product [Allacma fusca]|uniref:Methylmalonic aciduria type A protein, mitochondrial n=1 Tax=Allacma fusca TaxID=39272 RepID=A0A8J2KG65_9HEXA|nr:unnamed protein product [Allacma fusca]
MRISKVQSIILGGNKYNWACLAKRRIAESITRKYYSDLKPEINPEVTELLKGLRDGRRASLATAITLVETENVRKKKLANRLLNHIMQESQVPTSYRIGISGPPGAGKSTFIEAFGKFLTSMGHRVAVLAVDPSSSSTGGSLLGDKTRMPELTRDPNAYIRPSPARGFLGGVTRSTNESIVLCEYANYDMILVETVGVGQSEYAVANMVDIFVVLLPPGGGDELQGVKRGIVEKADLLVVTKGDGDLLPAAHRTQYEYTAAIKFMRPTNPKWKTKVLQVSSKTKTGLDTFWEQVNNFKEVTKEDFLAKRGDQREVWMWTHVQEGLERVLLRDSRLKHLTNSLLDSVRDGKISPGSAADEILSLFEISEKKL